MEKRILKKVDEYIEIFKNNIKEHIEKTDIDFEQKSNILKFVYDLDNIALTKEDFCKRKRSKSTVPQYLRCMAKKSCGDQCSRKKQDNNDYCGTHDKNRPYGIIDDNIKNTNSLVKKQIWLEEINGISYYIDDENNVYKTEDIIKNVINPNVIYKYIRRDNELKIVT
tara:strand:+ start:317 stop:817 length:501 start_codon:yes stop_codon:yes gene_type:complete